MGGSNGLVLKSQCVKSVVYKPFLRFVRKGLFKPRWFALPKKHRFS